MRIVRPRTGEAQSEVPSPAARLAYRWRNEVRYGQAKGNAVGSPGRRAARRTVVAHEPNNVVRVPGACLVASSGYGGSRETRYLPRARRCLQRFADGRAKERYGAKVSQANDGTRA